MKLKEVFDQLSYGELSHLAIGNNGEGIAVEKYPAVTAHVNAGLTALYKRFLLKEGELVVQLFPDRVSYPLISKFAEYKRNSREPDRFIMDSFEEQYADDLFKVERVYTDAGYELSINDLTDEFSIHSTALNTIKVPEKIVTKYFDMPDRYKTDTLMVVYRANHPKIDASVTGFNPSRVELELPPSHLEPLLLYVASRLYNPIGVNNTEFHMGNNYAAKYEKACAELEMRGFAVDQVGGNDRLSKNGWV